MAGRMSVSLSVIRLRRRMSEGGCKICVGITIAF